MTPGPQEPEKSGDQARSKTSRAAVVRAVSLPVFAGFLIRAIPVLAADFPLNDGGLFYAMTQDLQAANYLLPTTTSYNGMDIPFAYPPLAFYLAGIISSGLGVALIDLFRVLPLAFATAAIPAVYLLAREFLSTEFQALLATWAFAFLPRAFNWSIAGGGVTRSLGLFLAVLAILEGVRFFRTGQRRHGVATAILTALTVMSHPGAALFTGISLLLVFLTFGRTRQAFQRSLVYGSIAMLVASPWWISVMSTHGLAPFLSGGQTSTDPAAGLQRLVTFTFTDEPYLTFLAVLGLIGLLYGLATRRYLLPAWVVVAFAIDPRSALAVMVPLAMLIAVAVDEVLLGRRAALETAPDRPSSGTRVIRDRFAVTLLGAGLLLGVAGGVQASGVIASPLHALPLENRSTMQWIRDHAPPDSEFLVVSGSFWFVDANAEWFPVLAGHRSLNTVQGFEWLGKQAWLEQAWRNSDLQLCSLSDATCVRDWTTEWGVEDAWLYVPVATIDTLAPTGDCCAGLRSSLDTSSDYEVAFEGPGGAVYKPRGGT